MKYLLKKNHILKNIENFYFYSNNKLCIVISVLLTKQYTNLIGQRNIGILDTLDLLSAHYCII